MASRVAGFSCTRCGRHRRPLKTATKKTNNTNNNTFTTTTASTTTNYQQQQQRRRRGGSACAAAITTTTTTTTIKSSSPQSLLLLSREKSESFLSSSRMLFSGTSSASSKSSGCKSRSSQQQINKRGRRRNMKTIKCESETRIASVLTSLPQRLDLYFQRRSYRMLLWKTIFIFVGFYLASVITLSFGALGINDVVAGALCVFVYETITRWYYKTNRPGRKLEFVNCFKLGLVYSLIADAFKLGS